MACANLGQFAILKVRNFEFFFKSESKTV